ncbi:MAG: flagellar hook-basal body complex protein FliE [Treponema sp.]|nr:flagellar hook-basal body complex protein FliE [Treponema sp.]
MKIPELKNIQLNKTHELHNGQTRISTENAASSGVEKTRRSFDDYLIQAFEKLNDQQVNVANLQQQVITDPDSVDLHDVTIAMSKARMSLNLAQTVIDRLVQGWSEITTTR